MYQDERTTTDLVANDPFTQAFHEIDVDSDGVITRADLEDFVRRNEFADETIVRSWMKLFETADGDLITMKLYREKLGLLEDVKKYPKSPRASSPEVQGYPALRNPEIRVISANMPTERQAEVIEQVYRLTGITPNPNNNESGGNSTALKPNESQTVADLKQWLESRFGGVWHVLIIRGSYWMQYSHEIDCSFQFQFGSHVYLLWRTPAN